MKQNTIIFFVVSIVFLAATQIGFILGKEAGRAEITRELEGGREIITTNRIIIGRIW